MQSLRLYFKMNLTFTVIRAKLWNGLAWKLETEPQPQTTKLAGKLESDGSSDGTLTRRPRTGR